MIKVRNQISGDTIYCVLKLESFDTIQRMEVVSVTNKAIDHDYGFEILNRQAELHKKSEYAYVLNYVEILLEPVGFFIETIQEY